MPEGDTVFLAAHRLRKALAGQALTHGELRHPRLSTVDLAGWVVTEVRPVGKHLFIRFDNGRSLHSHLRMDGVWQLYPRSARWRGPTHEVRAVLGVAERVAVGFRLHDLALVGRDDEDGLVGHLGPDLVADDWAAEQDSEALRRLSEKPDRELGLALLDQSVVAGIGNVYLAETCFRLGISPFTPVGQLNQHLRAEIVSTARKLLRYNRLRPARSTTGDPRQGRRHWVYRRGGQGCRRCGTVIRSATLGSGVYARTTWWCPRCQPSAVSGERAPSRWPPVRGRR